MAILPNPPEAGESLRYAQILILEILPYIPAVKIFASLDLGQNISFLNGHYRVNTADPADPDTKGKKT